MIDAKFIKLVTFPYVSQECFGYGDELLEVSNEGILSDILSGIGKAIKWVFNKIKQVFQWFIGLFFSSTDTLLTDVKTWVGKVKFNFGTITPRHFVKLIGVNAFNACKGDVFKMMNTFTRQINNTIGTWDIIKNKAKNTDVINEVGFDNVKDISDLNKRFETARDNYIKSIFDNKDAAIFKSSGPTNSEYLDSTMMGGDHFRLKDDEQLKDLSLNFEYVRDNTNSDDANFELKSNSGSEFKFSDDREHINDKMEENLNKIVEFLEKISKDKSILEDLQKGLDKQEEKFNKELDNFNGSASEKEELGKLNRKLFLNYLTVVYGLPYLRNMQGQLGTVKNTLDIIKKYKV